MSHPHKENTNRSKVRKRIESPVVVTKRPKREGQPSLEPRPDNAPNAWQYTSNSRCITHGVLECKTCASKMDPQERKQRIDMINLTTPYERAKLEKLLFEVQNKEVKKRLAIIAEYDNFVSSIVEFRDTLASITEEERESRSGIVRQNKRLRRAYLRAFEVERTYLAFYEYEHEARNIIWCSENKDRLSLLTYFSVSQVFEEIQTRENITRGTIVYNENAARNRLFAAALTAQQAIEDQFTERGELLKVCLSGRSMIAKEFRDGCQEIAELKSFDLERIRGEANDREELYRQCVAEAEKLFAEAVYGLQCIKVEKEEELSFMEERHEMLLRSMEALAREEAYQRQILHDDVATHLNALFTEMSDSENRIRELVHQRLDDVNRFCMNASSAVTRVRESEDEAWRSLMQLEAEERERCAQLKMEKEAAIQKFCSDSFAAMQQVAAEEAEAFHQLNSSMRDEESRIAEQHAWLLRRSQETYMQCVTEVQDIKEEEHTARFQLLSLMAKGEETIHRQQRVKEQEIHSLEKEEADSRGHVCQGEEVARENLYYAFDRDARLVEERVRGQQERLEAFCRSALDLLRALQEEESTRFAEIVQTFLLECNAIRLRESFKQQLVIQQEEAQGRSFVEVEEQSMRGIMIGKKNAILQFFADERDRVWRAFALSIAQVVEEERGQREMLSQRESSVRDAFRQSELEERRRLTEPVLDDAYLYRKQLLLSTLSVSGEVKLTAEQIDTALHILDCASEKEKEAQQSLKVAQKRAKDLTRKMARLEDACKEEAEKKEDIRNRLTREEGERERRLNAEVDASRRDAEQIAVEKRKLEESEEELRKQEAILASFKAKINKQYSR